MVPSGLSLTKSENPNELNVLGMDHLVHCRELVLLGCYSGSHYDLCEARRRTPSSVTLCNDQMQQQVLNFEELVCLLSV